MRVYTVNIIGRVCMVPLSYVKIGNGRWYDHKEGHEYTGEAMVRLFAIL